MRKAACLALLCALLAIGGDVALAEGYGPQLESFEAGVAFTPPHNEPIVQDMVARYKIEADGSVRILKRITFDANVRFWFLQGWRTPDAVGHGFPDAWRGSDWNFERVRADLNLKLGVDVCGPVQAYVEHGKYNYVTASMPTSHISEYSWMAGLRYRWKP